VFKQNKKKDFIYFIKNKKINIFISFFVLLMFSACNSSKHLDISKYSININDKLNLHNACKILYNQKNPSVAVVNFTNNSSFNIANTKYNNNDFYAGIGLNIIGVGIGSKSSKYTNSRIVKAKLASAFIPMIESMIRQTGGVNLFTRSDYDKIDAELKLQDSGLLDPKSVVEFGLNSGVKYLVTGSIDYVSHNYKNYSNITGQLLHASLYTNDDKAKIAAATLHLSSSFFDGTEIKTAVTIKILDVASGKIVFSKQLKNKSKLNSNIKPSYSQLVEAIKENISQALPLVQNKLNNYFKKNGYISRIKSNMNDKIVQISLGSNDMIKESDEFLVYNVDVSKDPLTNQISCQTLFSNITLMISKNISSNNSWATVIQGEQDKLKLLQIVKRK